MKQLPLFPNACLIAGLLILFNLTSCASLTPTNSQLEAPISSSVQSAAS